MGINIELKIELTCDNCYREINKYETGVIVIMQNDSKSFSLDFQYYSYKEFQQEIKVDFVEIQGSRYTKENSKIIHAGYSCLQEFLNREIGDLYNWMQERKKENEPTEEEKAEYIKENFTETPQIPVTAGDSGTGDDFI